MKHLLIKKHISRWTAMLLCVIMTLSVCSVPAFAYERIDTSKNTSLTAYFKTEDGTGIQGVSFRLYRVADVSDAVTFELTKEFSGSSVSLENIESASKWSELALTLTSYADANELSPLQIKETAEDGSVSFTDLSTGLYLIVGDYAIVGDKIYEPQESLILLPTLQEDDSWSYTPSIDVKYETEPVPDDPDEETQNITVKKVWSGDSSSERPSSVSIQLLINGEVSKTVDLSAKNGWTYTWKDLPVTYEDENGEEQVFDYKVNEPNAFGYKVSTSKSESESGTTYTVKNTKQSTPTNPTTPTTTAATTAAPNKTTATPTTTTAATNRTTAGTTTPTVTTNRTTTATVATNRTTTVTSNATSAGKTTTTSETTNKKLPQTGALNWPIPVLTISGLVLVGAGWYLFNRKKEK